VFRTRVVAAVTSCLRQDYPKIAGGFLFTKIGGCYLWIDGDWNLNSDYSRFQSGKSLFSNTQWLQPNWESDLPF